MIQSQVPLMVMTDREENVEIINRTLREAGHRVRCQWVTKGDGLIDALAETHPELLFLFTGCAKVADAAKACQAFAPMVPLLLVADGIEETTMADAMAAGARDVVSLNELDRLRAVAERELRAFRLERALNDTLVSASRYKNQLKAFVAGSEDAFAHAQEGILVEANASWAELFGQPDARAVEGEPLMDSFDSASQAALKGALVACQEGQWDSKPLRVAAISQGATIPLELWLTSEEYDGEPAVRLSVPRTKAQNSEPEHLIEQTVHKDPMTGFYHRPRFVELLTDRLETNAPGGVRALVYVRPDKFGEIKDAVGPLASEDILVQLAEVLQGLTQPNDIYGRFGGLVFTLLLERGTLRDVEAWAENALVTIAEQMFEVAKNTLSVTCTIGLSEVTSGMDRVEPLITDAEKANKRGRQRGGNQVVVAEISDESTRVKRFDQIWVETIKSALLDNRFRLVHLPMASLTGKNVTYYDTVLRMLDPQQNEILATEFAPAAERNKLLKAIDRWVIGASISFCRANSPDRVFVKLSKDSIADPTLQDWLDKRISAANVDPDQICFQVSEEDVTQHLKQTKALAETLKQKGFGFAVEHFGIGRDPMQVLGHTPMNYLKIDGSLMQSIANNQALQEQVRQYVKAAEARKISTIAERVEDANTMAVLFQLGLNYIQGHYVHEPEVILEETPSEPALSPLPTGSDS